MKYTRQNFTEIDGHTVLVGEKGVRFYHKHLSPKARAKKKAARRQQKASRRS